MDATTTLLFGIPLLILIPLALAFLGLKSGIKQCKTKPANFKEILFVMWALSYVACFIVTYLALYTPIAYAIWTIGAIGVAIGLLAPLALLFFLDYVFLRHIFGFEKDDAIHVSVPLTILTNALVILFIVSLLLTFIDSAGGFYKTTGRGSSCVSNPINELVTMIKKAEAGITTFTSSICMKSGDQFSSTALTEKVTNVAQLTFKCEGAAVCKNNNPLEVTSDSVTAKSDTRFACLISCTESDGDYTCDIVIKSP